MKQKVAHSEDSKDIESSWEKEIADRVRAVDEGRAVGIDFDEAMKKIEERFTL